MSTTNEQAAPVALYRFHVGLYAPDLPSDDRSVSKRRALALRILSDRFEAFTVQDVRGFWRGESEPSVVVEVYAPDDGAQRSQARECAETLREALAQECIGLAILPASFLLI